MKFKSVAIVAGYIFASTTWSAYAGETEIEYPTCTPERQIECIMPDDPKLIAQLPIFGLIGVLLATPPGRAAASAAVASATNDGYEFKDSKCRAYVLNDGFIAFYWHFTAARKSGALKPGDCNDINALVRDRIPQPLKSLEIGTEIIKCACEAARL